ncbi:hypothetical protein BJ875DRAFT_168014 [Amylocarpus encephaloides]|uniref:Uncharacterized protein n=1 Tax=Amylocarpus encephaloides TaxID=45428 RepID=A0A9P7YPC8_9HELO|nr:hypothetical protein BJ875DRAFT_168014 [Amylocarpus encephaloides]
MGTGTSKVLLEENFKTSVQDYKFSKDLIHAFARSEMGFFRAEIRSLQAEPFKWSLSKILDHLKGGHTKEGVFEGVQDDFYPRLQAHRLFSFDVGIDAFTHRYRSLCAQPNWEDKGVDAYFYGGFLLEPAPPINNPSLDHRTPSLNVEPNNLNFAPPYHAGPTAYPTTSSLELMNPSILSQGSVYPTRMRSASTAVEHNSMLDDQVDQQHIHIPNPDQSTEFMISSPEPCVGSRGDIGRSAKVNRQKTIARADKMEMAQLNQSIRRLEDASKMDKSELESLTQQVRSLKDASFDDKIEIAQLKHIIRRLEDSSGVDKWMIKRLNQKHNYVVNTATLFESKMDLSLKKSFDEARQNAILELRSLMEHFQISASSPTPMENSGEGDGMLPNWSC